MNSTLCHYRDVELIWNPENDALEKMSVLFRAGTCSSMKNRKRSWVTWGLKSEKWSMGIQARKSLGTSVRRWCHNTECIDGRYPHSQKTSNQLGLISRAWENLHIFWRCCLSETQMGLGYTSPNMAKKYWKDSGWRTASRLTPHAVSRRRLLQNIQDLLTSEFINN